MTKTSKTEANTTTGSVDEEIAAVDEEISRMEAELSEIPGATLRWDEVTETTMEELGAKEERRRSIIPRLLN